MPLLLALALAVAPGVSPLLARVDAAWPDRDDPAKLALVTSALEEAEKLAPDDYEVLWRLARLDVWRSDDPATGAKERSRLGRRAWDAAERAVAKEPDRVEGQLYAALGMGNYALSLGVIRALREGIEGKFKARLSRAEAIAPAYLGGTIPVAWGRYWQELPWPKYDAGKSEAALRRALQVNPSNVRARVYLAELYVKERHGKRARSVLEEALRTKPGAYDPAEERRMQARARQLLATGIEAGDDDDRARRAGSEGG